MGHDLNSYGNDSEACLPATLKATLISLEADGRALATANPVFVILRRFAIWSREQPGHRIDPAACHPPIMALAVDEPDCKKVLCRDIYQLFKAAKS